ncbi:MAG: pitrilysin family protein, partial [bacterium]|nr:pitrilysin family protein [bacterium]
MRKTTLKNGLRILEIPQNASLAVTILVLVGTGTKNETKNLQGISHFLEHMFFKGTKKRKTAIAVSEPLDRVGGMYNAFTGYDYTGYYAKVDAKHFDLALDWVSDIFLNSLLPPKEIEKEKGVVIEELNMDNDAPMQRIQIVWRELLYGNQPAGWNIVGTKESIMGLTRKSIHDYMKSQYVAQNTVVCVAGNLKEETHREMEKKFHAVRSS